MAHKTKEMNTFRFKSFAERINDIDLRHLALYHIGHVYEELPEEKETYFHQTLKKWSVLNLSDEFAAFSRKCMKIVTLPQLIHQKEFLIDLMLERLATATNLSLQPLLELLHVMARDLREEFYPYFQRVLDRLICLLNTTDADQLEWTLLCLAHLFKTLKPHLKKNIGMVFHAILPLLDEQRYEEHLTNFAVECFSFIARDVRDFGKFLDFMLDTVAREQVESVQGCGRLCFEIVRGVPGQFHSCAGEFLQFLFECLVDVRRDCAKQTDLLTRIVEQAVLDLLQFIQPSYMSLFWEKLCAVTQATTDCSKLFNLIGVFQLAAGYRDGRYLTELNVVLPTILQMLDTFMAANHIDALKLLVKLMCTIALPNAANVTQLDLCRLTDKMLELQQREVYHDFILSIITHPQFEVLILPDVISRFERHFDEAAFELMANIVLHKQPFASNATGLLQWKPYKLQINDATTMQKIVAKMQQINCSETQLETDLLLLILLPHLSNLTTTDCEKNLNAATLKYSKDLKTAENVEKSLTVLSLLVETKIHLKLKFTKDFLEPATQALLPYLKQSIKALGCLDQLLAQNPKLFAGNSELHNEIAGLLSSHVHEVRLTAAHALKLLHRKEQHVSPYKILYEAECIEPTIHTYREKLRLLQQLDPASAFFQTLKQENYKSDTVLYLLGSLNYNFKFIWEPVLKLIEEYARVLSIDCFWEIYKAQMKQTAEGIYRSYELKPNELEISTISYNWTNVTLNKLLPAETMPKLTQQELLNYRNLLWLRLPQFGQIAEVKNADLVAIFLKFVNDEYRNKIETQEFTWDLCEGAQIDDTEIDLEDETVDTEKSIKSKRKGKGKKSNSTLKVILQTLQTKLGAFVKQPNPKALHREPELHILYMDLLAGPNAVLQKLALDCVLAYKSKALKPYKDQLYALADEQKFKDELVNFKLDTVNVECRAELMRILLRLLYGKMITKGSQSNVSPQVRKSLILRFLGQCSSAEILWFLQMAFGKYSKYTDAALPIEAIPGLVHDDFDIHAVWSPKKLQSIVNLLELLRKEFGGLMDEHFHIYTLKLLIFVGSVCNEVLHVERATRMHEKMPTVFRNVKNAALLSLVNFVAHIEQFAWQEQQIECLTAVFVWPIIEKLPHDSIHTPTALLKLLLQWGEEPKHFAYLNQKSPKNGQVIFHYLIELLLNEKAKIAVRKPILALIERMLVASAELDTKAAVTGLDIVKPFVPQILKRLKMNFNTLKAKRSLDKRDLHILSLLTPHVQEASTCDSLLQLMLPILIAKSQSNAGEEVVCQVITTLGNLIKQLEVPESYLLKLAPLFEQVHEVSARKMLCQLVADIAKLRHKQKNVSSALDERLRQTARLTLMLNAWDKRWVEQPDYDKRLDALKEITQLLEAGNVDMDLGVLIIYNCFYYLKHDKDMGLRDNASEQLQRLLPKLVEKYVDDKTQLNFLVGDVFINLLRRVLVDKQENVRNEGIRLLGVMVRECAHAHIILTDLAPLGDKLDAEVDFFENLTHLQSHRHGRALLKFCTHAETLTQAPNFRTLTQFVLPLATRYLLNDVHSGKHTLIDAAIETVGVACQLLPWQHYHTVLRYYLMRMRSTHEHQKQCVRIVVRILEAFHFDLSQTKPEVQALQQLKTELSKNIAEVQKNSKSAESVKAEGNQGDEKEAEEATGAANQVNDEHSLEDELVINSDEEDDEEKDVSPAQSIKLLPVLKQQLLLPPNASKRIMTTITTILIPTLNRSITEKSSFDAKHKVNRKRYSHEREEAETLRVPIALALVKLMQKLPKELLDASLPGVFMKVCTFLRSPLKSVRMLTRDILRKIMLTLGSSYLALLMDHLQTLLTRGFQIHVLSVTVHGVLDALRDQLQAGDIDNCLGNLLDVAINDIFGEISAEKQVQKIGAHTPEAKPSSKSYLVLHIAARNIQESCMLDLLMPFKEHLMRSQSRKVTLKIQECFAKIVSGFIENVHISRENLLIFIYGTMSESIIDLLPGTQKPTLSDQEKEKMRRARPDCLIIQPAPRMRSGAINKNVKSNAQANAHILIEFGLEMLHIVLKRKKLTEVVYEPFLNPILPLLRDALKSTHIRVSTFALKCFATIWNEEYKLPTMTMYMPDVVARMFEILQNFSTFGATRQEENLQLVKSVFKAIVAMLRKSTEYALTPEQVDQLVLHIEQDLHEDGEYQSLSFSLLKAMIARKVDTPAVHDIMLRIRELTIVSQSNFVRDETRIILFTYVMEYPLQKRVDQILKFFSVQLCYSLPSGRKSAITFLHMVIKKFPLNVLGKHAEFLYLSLGTRLVNDEDSECRASVAECIELLITRLEKTNRQSLFDMTLLFFEPTHKSSVREMAASLVSRFLEAEKQSFSPRLKLILPTVIARLTLIDPTAPGRFVRAPGAATEKPDVQQKRGQFVKRRKRNSNIDELFDDSNAIVDALAEKQRDHEIIQLQYCLLKMLEYCIDGMLNNAELSNTVDELLYESQKLLGHEHVWVRCNAAKIIRLILNKYDYEFVCRKLCKTEKNSNNYELDFIYLNPEYDIKSLVLDLCAQMQPSNTPEPMYAEFVGIFISVAKMLANVPFVMKREPQEKADIAEKAEKTKLVECTNININWLIQNIRFLINREVAQAPHSATMRLELFTLIGNIITLLSCEKVVRLTPTILPALVREMAEENIHTNLRSETLRIGRCLRNCIGSDEYDRLRIVAQTSLMKRRAERKKLIAQEKIHDPVRAAKRKAAMQERKKDSKKRKTNVIRGKAEDVKHKLKRIKRKMKQDDDDLF